MNSKAFSDFLLREGLRQDALVHSTSSQLETKVSLFMVFAAFVFTAESTLASFGAAAGLHLAAWPLALALMLALAGIGVLLWSARLQNYRMPPVLSVLRKESDRFFRLDDIQNLSEEQQMEKFNEKFVNSLARSVDENFGANRRIAKNLQAAICLIAVSLGVIFLALGWVVVKTLCASPGR